MACQLPKLEICFRKGSTIRFPLRLESDKRVWKPISGIELTAPVKLEVLGHGCPVNWRGLITGVEGTRQINSLTLLDSALQPITVVDSDHIEFNHINASAYDAYVPGTGFLMYYEPVDLSQFASARMNVRSRVGAPLLLSLSTTVTANGSLEIDTVTDTLWINMSAAISALLDFKRGVFDIELINGGDEVTALCSADSTLTILPEITTEHQA